MKKSILHILFIASIILVMTGCNKTEQAPEAISTEEIYFLRTTLNDGRNIHFALEVPYKDTNLGDSLLKNELSLEEFTSKLKYVDTLNDGGSKLYYYERKNKEFGDKDFYTIICNSVQGIKDIYIAKNRKSLDRHCSIKIDDLKNISLAIKEGTLENTGATFILKNNSDVNIIYGNPYWIEKETDGKWSKVKTVEDMNFTLPAFGLQPKETKEFKIDFEYGYGKLSSGKYRLVKDIDVEYEDNSRESFNVTAEFIIE